MSSVVVENKEQFKKLCRRVVSDSLTTSTADIEALFVELMTLSFECGVEVGLTGKAQVVVE